MYTQKAPLVTALACLMGAVMAHAGEPGIYHRYFMKGSVVDVSEAGIYLCIGTNDGAMAGQELDVFHVSQVSNGPKGAITMKREKVGRVRIGEVVDEHFATATIIEGKADKGDIVELEEKAAPPKK